MADVLILRSRLREVGNSQVRRLLPAAKKQAVGPFLFFDHFGPEEREQSSKNDVRPHPHIGLSTVTYLFEGSMVHRDSIGSVQAIEPGAINWMTAGRGVAHSERAPKELLGERRRTHGLQLWAGLPKALEEREPGFAHTPGGAIPEEERDGVRLRVLIGRAWGMESPVVPMSETLYVDIALPAGGALDIPALAAERAVYSVESIFSLQNQTVEPHTMAVLPAGDTRPARSAGASASGAHRRRAARRAALHVVELRLLQPRADQASRCGMGRAPHAAHPGRDRMGPAPGIAVVPSLSLVPSLAVGANPAVADEPAILEVVGGTVRDGAGGAGLVHTDDEVSVPG